MRSKELLRRRRSSQVKPRIWDHHLNLKSNQFVVHIKVIMLLQIMGWLLPGFILIFIRRWIIVGCISNHITFNILLCIQIMLHHKDRLLLAIIWSKKILVATRRVERTRSKIQGTYSKCGVPQTCLIPKNKDCNIYASKNRWSNKWRSSQQSR